MVLFPLGKEVYSERKRDTFLRAEASSLQPRGKECRRGMTTRAHQCVQRVYQPRGVQGGYLPRGVQEAYILPRIPTMVHQAIYTTRDTHHGTPGYIPPRVHLGYIPPMGYT